MSDHTFTDFSDPSVAYLDQTTEQTVTLGINDFDKVVGYYTIATGTIGFLESNGVFSTIAYPQASETVASGINNNGEIVGTYDGASGFIYTNGSYSNIMPPPGSFSFQVNGVNNEGQIVGSYQASGGQLGFVLTASFSVVYSPDQSAERNAGSEWQHPPQPCRD